MIYGCQWDATMNWMTQEPNPTVTGAFYVSNSTNMGWYRENGSYNPNNLTGFDYAGVYNKVRNIYDLAGLNYEFTQEACDTDKRTWRGGFITGYGNERPAFHRSMHYPSGDESCYGSSRLQLYIKTK